AEARTGRGAQEGKLKGHGNKCRPAIQRAAPDIHGVGQGVHPILETKTANTTGQTAEQGNERHVVALQTHGFVEAFDGKRRKGVYVAIAGLAHLLDGFEELFRSSKQEGARGRLSPHRRLYAVSRRRPLRSHGFEAQQRAAHYPARRFGRWYWRFWFPILGEHLGLPHEYRGRPPKCLAAFNPRDLEAYV